MAAKKRKRHKRKSHYIRAGRKGHVKRGACGRGYWRRGGGALWACSSKKRSVAVKWKPKKKYARGK